MLVLVLVLVLVCSFNNWHPKIEQVNKGVNGNSGNMIVARLA